MSLESPAFREETNPAFSLPKNIYIKKNPPIRVESYVFDPQEELPFRPFHGRSSFDFCVAPAYHRVQQLF